MKTDLTVCACIIAEGKLLLILHRKLRLWLFPGGHIEKDETPDAAVRREVAEEVGLRVELVKGSASKGPGEIEVLAVPFYVNLHSVGDHHHVGFFYLCTTPDSRVQLNAEESDAYRWLSAGELASSPLLTGDIRKIAQLAFERYDALRR